MSDFQLEKKFNEAVLKRLAKNGDAPPVPSARVRGEDDAVGVEAKRDDEMGAKANFAEGWVGGEGDGGGEEGGGVERVGPTPGGATGGDAMEGDRGRGWWVGGGKREVGSREQRERGMEGDRGSTRARERDSGIQSEFIACNSNQFSCHVCGKCFSQWLAASVVYDMGLTCGI